MATLDGACAGPATFGPHRLGIHAVVTAYKPDAGFAARFRPLLARCDAIVVVDNTPGGHDFGALPGGFTVLQDGVNKGLGPALNAGIAGARTQGARTIVLFDQDSTPDAALIDSLFGALQQATDAHGPRCIVGPSHLDDAALGEGTADVPATLSDPGLYGVSCLPTSGMMFPVAPLDASAAFADDLFLDLVDFEWCWRLQQSGWRCFRAAGVAMFHRLGIEQRSWLGLTFHVAAPYRHYYQVRDTLRLSIRGYVPAYAKLRLCGVLPVKLLLFPLMLDRGLERLRWMVQGLWDALRQVHGIGAARRRLGGPSA